jgi:2-hydroxychromene-2-carboxylate isomerase
MTPRVEFFFSFRSPYSYLAAPRAFGLPERFDVDLAYRGVIPMAMRGQAVPRAKRLHTLRDVDREAARLGLPFGRIHDPIGAGAERCLLVAEHAVDAGRERDFVLEASRGIWAEAVDVASDGGGWAGVLGFPRDGGLRSVAERAGLRWDACRTALEDPALRARVDASTARLDELGHWGVPVLVHRGELYWGQDHVEDLEAVLRQEGLER